MTLSKASLARALAAKATNTQTARQLKSFYAFQQLRYDDLLHLAQETGLCLSAHNSHQRLAVGLTLNMYGHGVTTRAKAAFNSLLT